MLGEQASRTIAARASDTPSNDWLAPRLNAIFNEHDLQAKPANPTYLKPLSELTDSSQSPGRSTPAPDNLPTTFASPALASRDFGSDHSTDALASYLMQFDPASRLGRMIPKPQMILGNGTIDISCTTTPASGGNPEQTLASADKLNPGWLSNVNWSDDDNDGWDPASTKTTTADPSATYTPDKDDTNGIAGGDPDLRKFVIRVTDAQNTPLADFSFKLTFGSNVGVYYSNTKSTAVTSGHVFSNAELTFAGDNGVITGIQTLWLEGRVASTSFRDVELKAEYVGGNIPLNKTTDTVKVTVFGVEQTAICAGTQKADDKFRFSSVTVNGVATKLSRNENGIISWDTGMYPTWAMNPPDGEGIEYCRYFANCMEMQGTVKPPRDARVSVYYGEADDPSDPANPQFPPPPAPLVTFSQTREAYGWAYGKKIGGAWTSFLPSHLETGKWKPDNNASAQSNIPTMTSHIYYADAPCYLKKTNVDFDYFKYCVDYRNSVLVNIYGASFMCSDWARWYSQMVLKPKPNSPGFLTRGVVDYQILQDGWFTLPTEPPSDLEIGTY